MIASHRPLSLFCAALAFVVVSAARVAPAQGGPDSDQLVDMILNADPQYEAVFLSWSKVPGATIALRWRSAGSNDWTVRPPTSTNFDMVEGLKNGVLYEFQPVLTGDGTTRLGPRVRLAPRERIDCDAGSHVFCTQERLLAAFPRYGIASTEVFCYGQAVEITSVMPNCRYTWGDVVLGLNRSYGSRFTPPLMRPRQDVARTVLSHAVWGMDFDSAKKEFAPTVYEVALPFPSRVDRGDRVRTYVARIGPTMLSRISWYTPANAIANRFALYHEGHGETALGGGAYVINWLLENGWTVIAMDMPLDGINIVDQTIDLETHDSFAALENASTDPIRWFFTPVLGVVNLIYDKVPPGTKPVIMLLGRSGGGWTISTYAAMDSRVDIAVDISGAGPLSTALDSTVMNLVTPHYEVQANKIYDQISLTEVLLTAGTKGDFFFYSDHDPCCFRFRSDHPWVKYLQRLAVTSSRKNYRVFIDNAPQHGVSDRGLSALGQYLTELGLPPIRGDTTLAIQADSVQ